MKEIGSEFWDKYLPVYPKKAENEAYLLSGRTALKFIIDDICRERNFRSVLLPSYCCESMIEPFDKGGVKVEFYPVHHDRLDYSYDNDADAVLLIDLFGYKNSQNVEIARRERKNGKVVIYDATHKIDGNRAILDYINYSFCSYRKWFYCNFAKAVKYCGAFNKNDCFKRNEAYVEIRDTAAYEKAKYVTGLISDKKYYLSGFSLAEQILNNDYDEYIGDPVFFDIEHIISKRRENALYLIEELKKIPGVKVWHEELRDEDTPLFVPIMVNEAIRYDFRKYLSDNLIYCPIHWPLSQYHSKSDDLYKTELSLICDQRYNLSDMERIVCTIEKYFDK